MSVRTSQIQYKVSPDCRSAPIVECGSKDRTRLAYRDDDNKFTKGRGGSDGKCRRYLNLELLAI